MPIFVDTNVLVYGRDSAEPDRQARAQQWIEHLWRTRGGRLSFQVLHEFYVTVTAELKPGLAADEARADVRDLLAWGPLPADAGTLEDAWYLGDRHSLSFWDSLIVASARLAGCDQLLTEDLSDGAVYGGVLATNPFDHLPPASSPAPTNS